MTDKPDCKCFSCGFTRAVEAAFPDGIDHDGAEAILAIIAAHAGQIIAQLGKESLVEFSMRVAVARAFSGGDRPSGSVH